MRSRSETRPLVKAHEGFPVKASYITGLIQALGHTKPRQAQASAGHHFLASADSSTLR